MDYLDRVLDNAETIGRLQVGLMAIENNLTMLKKIRAHFQEGGHYFTKSEEEVIIERLTRQKRIFLEELEKIKDD